ncbi:MAG: response regulator transcription factor [Planctomycetota bacterium]|nr:response regulator transcription factor [Planctomycetota bacterium]MDA1177763.1 response regulator transcription factor [Planctomycetota bacterium]
MSRQSPKHDSERILLVEDELHLATGIKFNLEAEGYQVTAVADGSSALRVFREEHAQINLVILDLMLPGMSGYTVCEEIRKSDAEVPILILSARSLSEDRTRGFDVGADQYLTKPFELDELLSRVRRLITRLRRSTAAGDRAAASEGAMAGDRAMELPTNTMLAADSDTFDQGRVRVDGDRYQLHVGDQVEQLTSRELQVLRYFLTHPDRVVSRSELLEEVWGQPGYLQTRAVDQFIRRLRKLIEINPSDPRHLVTVRDAGYRFLPEPVLLQSTNQDSENHDSENHHSDPNARTSCDE